MKVVYCVMHGEIYEGLELVSIHKTKEGARAAAVKVKPSYDYPEGQTWVYMEPEGTWDLGDEYIMIVEKELKE